MAERAKIDAPEPIALYKALEQARPSRPTKAGKAIADMSAEELRAYKTQSKRDSRKRQREAAEKGDPEPTRAVVMSALADAAIAILATGKPGYPGFDLVMGILQRSFQRRPGVPGKILADIRNGKLAPESIRIVGKPGEAKKPSKVAGAVVK